MKTTIFEMKNILEGINIGFDEAEDQISYLEEKIAENTQSEQQKEKSELRDFWDNVKHNSICIIGVPEGEEREQGIKNPFEEIVSENVSDLLKEKDTLVFFKITSFSKLVNKYNCFPAVCELF